MTPNDSLHHNITMGQIENIKNTPKHICPYCDKEYSKNCHLRRHEKTCKAKKQYIENRKKNRNIRKEIKELKETKSLTNNTTNNNTTNNNNNNCNNTNNNSHNNITNYLNINFSNVQPMEKFIENFKTKFPLTEADRLCLLNTYNECDIGLFSDTFST